MNIIVRHLADHPTDEVVSMIHLLTALGLHVGPKRIRRLEPFNGKSQLKSLMRWS